MAYYPDAGSASLNVIDDIVDRVRAGHYCKNPVTLQEMLSTGLVVGTSISNSNNSPGLTPSPPEIKLYCNSRYHELTPRGRTMRINKLIDKFNELIKKFDKSEFHAISNAVWLCEVDADKHRYDRNSVYILGAFEEVKMHFELIYKPCLTNCDSARTYFKFVRLGDESVVRFKNNDNIEQVTKKVNSIEYEISRLQVHLGQFKLLKSLIANE